MNLLPFVLSIVAYYSRIRSKGLDEMVESLKSQIANVSKLLLML